MDIKKPDPLYYAHTRAHGRELLVEVRDSDDNGGLVPPNAKVRVIEDNPYVRVEYLDKTAGRWVRGWLPKSSLEPYTYRLTPPAPKGKKGSVPKAEVQATDSGLRHRWKFDPAYSPRDLLEQSKLIAWLEANKICDRPVSTPSVITRELQTLKTYLGNPAVEGQTFARVSTIRIKRGLVTSGPTRQTTYKTTERFDYAPTSDEPPEHVQVQNKFIAKACASIALKFLEISGYGDFLFSLLDGEQQIFGHNAYVHVDWYPRRAYNSQGFHKDTQGSTLFVGLIYMNDEAIRGPDVILNPSTLDERETTRNPSQQRRLPRELTALIDKILSRNPTTMQISQTPPIPAGGGMVWFVDELIYHSTPHVKIHGRDLDLSIGGSQIVKHLKATWPLEKDWQSHEGQVKNNDPYRQFVRIWVTLEPPRDMKQSLSKSIHKRPLLL